MRIYDRRQSSDIGQDRQKFWRAFWRKGAIWRSGVALGTVLAALAKPANAGQLNFYIKAVDSQLRKEGDRPTIGLLLCKGRDKLVAEYALSDIHKPVGVSEYKLTHSLPKKLKSSLPTIKEIERELIKGIKKAK